MSTIAKKTVDHLVECQIIIDYEMRKRIGIEQKMWDVKEMQRKVYIFLSKHALKCEYESIETDWKNMLQPFYVLVIMAKVGLLDKDLVEKLFESYIEVMI